jgi:hypothetical protein
MHNLALSLLMSLAIFLTGCTTLNLTPELVQALAKDEATLCLAHNLQGGAGGAAFTPAPMIPLAGWGASAFILCRSNQPDAKVTLSPTDGISIQHGQPKN